MQDNEFRVMFTGERGQLRWVDVYCIDPDGQVSLGDAWEIGPFTTLDETLRKVGRVIRQHLTLVAQLR